MSSPQIHPQPVDYLLSELARVKRENKRLRRRAYWLDKSRAYWRNRARRLGL